MIIPTSQFRFLRYTDSFFSSAELFISNPFLAKIIFSLPLLFYHIHNFICISETILSSPLDRGTFAPQRLFIVFFVTHRSRMIWRVKKHFIGQLECPPDIARHVGREPEVLQDVSLVHGLLLLPVELRHRLLHPERRVVVVLVVVALAADLETVAGRQLRAVVLAVDDALREAG